MQKSADILTPSSSKLVFDVERIRKDFPVLRRQVNGKPLVYFDNAATSQKPQIVIDAISRYYEEENSNIHRGVHQLSEKATLAYEQSRKIIQKYLNASSTQEIIFVRGTTEGVNLVAASFGKKFVHAGDEILISAMEHHSNIVPWQILCQEKNATLKIIPMNDRGELILDAYEKLLTSQTRIVALTHISNALGTINPVKEMIAMAHARGIPVLIDGAQALPHMRVDVADLDCDFYAFSGHKVFGPTGVGILFGKAKWLDEMPPYQSGGDMIKSVTFEKTIYNDLPYKFEAGTPGIAGGICLGTTLDYLSKFDMESVSAHEHDLLEYATESISMINGIKIIGTAEHKASVLSFIMENVHPHDIGTILDDEGIAIRTGHHCAQPVMQRFGIPATARASFAFYNTRDEIDVFINALHKVIKVFA
ncbi:MAG: SufS family cysteine desulfurase [Bacteroidota bacterium]